MNRVSGNYETITECLQLFQREGKEYSTKKILNNGRKLLKFGERHKHIAQENSANPQKEKKKKTQRNPCFKT